MAALDSIHVKVKRKSQTFFLLIENPDAPTMELKEKLCLLLGDKCKDPVDMRLMYEGTTSFSMLIFLF